MSDSVVLVGAARTPLGAFNGQFKRISAPFLASAAVTKVLDGLPDHQVSELLMGCVLPAGTGQAPARQVVSLSGLPLSCGATTVNRACGSSLKTLEMAVHALHYHGGGLYITGGMENMSLAPHLLPNSRQGFRLGEASLQDHVFIDGLMDASQGLLMGEYAEQTADTYGFTREAQDEFAQESLRRAKQAVDGGLFEGEIAPVEIKRQKALIVEDEIPASLDIDKIPRLKPAFREGGTVTAANASSLADGAAALALTLESVARHESYPILARVSGVSSHSHQPEHFTTAPVPAIQKLLKSRGLSVADIDLWEINEAFAVVPMAAMKELNISRDRLNIGGGACALGHPLGATGARILVSLLGAMQRKDVNLGVASLCIGGGEGMAVLLERI